MLLMPFNIRMSLPGPNDRTLVNKIAAHPYFLPISLDLAETLRKVHVDLSHVKSNFVPLATSYISSLIMSLPDHLARRLIYHYASKPTLTMTNVFGPPFPVTLCGSRSCKVYALLPSMADVSGGFAVVSHYDTVKVSFVADASRTTDAALIIRRFEETMDEIINA